MYGLSHGAYWGLSLEAPAPSSLPPDVLRDLERAGVVPPGTAAQVGGVVVTKRLKQTRRPELVTAPGPLALGNPQNGTYRDLYGASWALALYRGGPQLFQARAGVWVDRTDPDALGELVKGGVRHVSLAFDQAARPVLAWERDGAVYVRQWSAQAGRYVTRGPWAGRDPLLTTDALAGHPVADSDVFLLYLDGGAVVSRVQREAYEQPRPLAAAPGGAVLDQIVPAPAQLQVIGAAGAVPLVWRTPLYDVQVRDRLTTGAALAVTLTLPRNVYASGTDDLAAGAALAVTLVDQVTTRNTDSDELTELSTGAVLAVVIATPGTAYSGNDLAAGAALAVTLGKLPIIVNLSETLAAGAALQVTLA